MTRQDLRQPYPQFTAARPLRAIVKPAPSHLTAKLCATWGASFVLLAILIANV